MTEPTAPRGTPPNQKQLAKELGDRLPLWDAAIALGRDFGATWRWMHSEATGTWSYRAYLPGDRFFVALSIPGGRIEASLNLKQEEWDWVALESAAERELVDPLRDQALATNEDPAWVHLPIATQAALPALSKLLFARGRRVQPPRSKQRKRR